MFSKTKWLRRSACLVLIGLLRCGVALAQTAGGDSTFPTANGQRVAGTVDMTCNSTFTVCGPASPGSPVPTKPSTYVGVPFDVATTTTANTAVTALIAGHSSAGGWVTNPVTATTVICVNFLGTAAFSGGACVGSNNGLSPGVSIPIPPSTGAVSVVSSDASHAFSGQGLQ